MAAFFRWGHMQWRMLGIFALAITILIGPLLTAALLLLAQQEILALFSIIAWFGWLIAIGARLAVSGPIVADEGSPHAFRQSWILSREHKRGLRWGVILGVGGVFTIVGIHFALAHLFGFDDQGFVVMQLSTFVANVWTTIGTAFFAIAYVRLRKPQSRQP